MKNIYCFIYCISIVKNFEWEHASIIISIQLKWSKEIVVAECIGEGRVHNILINITHYVRMNDIISITHLHSKLHKYYVHLFRLGDFFYVIILRSYQFL